MTRQIENRMVVDLERRTWICVLLNHSGRICR